MVLEDEASIVSVYFDGFLDYISRKTVSWIILHGFLREQQNTNRTAPPRRFYVHASFSNKGGEIIRCIHVSSLTVKLPRKREIQHGVKLGFKLFSGET